MIHRVFLRKSTFNPEIPKTFNLPFFVNLDYHRKFIQVYGFGFLAKKIFRLVNP